jgi:S-adenosylmethionine synthetase
MPLALLGDTGSKPVIQKGVFRTQIDKPKMANAQVLLEKGQTLQRVSKGVEDIFNQAFGDINKFCMELAHGKYPVC